MESLAILLINVQSLRKINSRARNRMKVKMRRRKKVFQEKGWQTKEVPQKKGWESIHCW
jgi:hypothetical protein